MPNINIFDTNDIRTTGLTVEGRAVISGATNAVILEVTGASGTNLQVIDDPASDLIWSLSGTSGYLFDVYEDRIDTSVPINSSGTTTFQTVNVIGELVAGSKSFDIEHPSLEGYRIRYGSLEGPEHAIYQRGRATNTVIYFPNHWEKLVDFNTITVHLTSVGMKKDYWVKRITTEYIEIGSEDNLVDCFYNIYAERIDVPKITVIYKPL